jgi:HlyD family secretion protein
MDRELDSDVRRRRLARRIAGGVTILGVGAVLLVGLPRWLRPSVARSKIRIAEVERGPVASAIEASGTVIPASEKTVSSPIEARVVRILKRAGQPVHDGDTLVELDTSVTRLEIGRLEDQLAQKRNEQTQLRIALDRILDDLEDQTEKARLDLDVLEARLARDRKLRADGLVSDETLREAEVEAQKAQLTLDHLAASMRGERRATAARLEGTALDLRILEKEQAEARHRLDLANARAAGNGVVTWVVAQEGATVARGEVVARVARLDTFRVDATVSDVHASRLAPGLPVEVVVDGRRLDGRLASVNPAIENGTARFLVDLLNPEDRGLRSNLRVDVYVVTGTRDEALRIARGPFADAGAVRQVFVVEGGVARRRPVRFGLASRDFLEVLDGLRERDQVIVSDMQDYLGLTEVRLR